MSSSTYKVEDLVNSFEFAANSIKKVSRDLEEVLKISQNNSVNVEKIISSIDSLNEMVNKLDEILNHYRT